MVDAEEVPAVIQRRDDSLCLSQTPESRLPGDRDAVIGGRYAVGGQLPVGVDQRDVEREHGTRARHDLPFEGIAMDVHGTRKDKGAAHLDVTMAAGRSIACHRGDASATAVKGCRPQAFAGNQANAAGKRQIRACGTVQRHHQLHLVDDISPVFMTVS